MKRITLVLFLFIASFSLTSFGIISNPNASVKQNKDCNTLVVNSKSTVKIQQCLAKPLVDADDVELKDDNQKSFLRSFFGFVYKALTKLVLAIVSK